MGKVDKLSELYDIFQNHKGRVIHKWLHYFPVYEQWFDSYRGRDITFLEIGCGEGGSLQMWKEYFSQNSTQKWSKYYEKDGSITINKNCKLFGIKIIGIDSNPTCKEYEEENIHIRIGDQADTDFLMNVINEFGCPDIVLDDGSHIMSDINASFQFLYPLLKDDGVYMVEDLHTAYCKEYGGGYLKQGTFLENCKDMIDQLNAQHTKVLKPNEFSKTTNSMHFYDSMVIFKKGIQTARIVMKAGQN